MQTRVTGLTGGSRPGWHRRVLAAVFRGVVILALAGAMPAGAVLFFETNQSGTITITGCTDPGAVQVPAVINGLRVTAVGDSAFSGLHELTGVTLPEGVGSIGALAFADCIALAGLGLPASITNIGEGAFSGCVSLESVTIPSKVVELRRDVFSHCTSLAVVSVPAGVEAIGDNAFYGCTSLGGITLPAGLLHIGNYAFAQAFTLASIGIPGGVVSIPSYAFYGCSGLAEVNITNGVTAVESYAFYGCSSLGSIRLPSSLMTIGSHVFHGCWSLGAVQADPASASFSSRDGVLFDKGGATLIQYPLAKSGAYTIPAGVGAVGDAAFTGCTGLTSVVMGNGVTRIGSYAFSGCDQLREVTLGTALTALPEGIVSGCYSLPRITIPAGVGSLGGWVFAYCPGLVELVFLGNAPTVGEYAFEGVTNSVVSRPGGSSGWGGSLGGLPVTIAGSVAWAAVSGAGMAGDPARFGFTIVGASNLVVVVEGSAGLGSGAWVPVATNTLTGGRAGFIDAQSGVSPRRFYRLRWVNP